MKDGHQSQITSWQKLAKEIALEEHAWLVVATSLFEFKALTPSDISGSIEHSAGIYNVPLLT